MLYYICYSGKRLCEPLPLPEQCGSNLQAKPCDPFDVGTTVGRDQQTKALARALLIIVGSHKGVSVTTLRTGWRRESLRNCPICGGSGEVFWQLSSSTKPVEWMCIGRKKPKPPKKKGALLIAETELSIEQRKVWMEYAARYGGSCTCVTQARIDFVQLKKIATQLQRIAHNERPPQHDLDDPLDDLFPGPYIYSEFLK